MGDNVGKLLLAGLLVFGFSTIADELNCSQPLGVCGHDPNCPAGEPMVGETKHKITRENDRYVFEWRSVYPGFPRITCPLNPIGKVRKANDLDVRQFKCTKSIGGNKEDPANRTAVISFDGDKMVEAIVEIQVLGKFESKCGGPSAGAVPREE